MYSIFPLPLSSSYMENGGRSRESVSGGGRGRWRRGRKEEDEEDEEGGKAEERL